MPSSACPAGRGPATASNGAWERAASAAVPVAAAVALGVAAPVALAAVVLGEVAAAVAAPPMPSNSSAWPPCRGPSFADIHQLPHHSIHGDERAFEKSTHGARAAAVSSSPFAKRAAKDTGNK